MAWIILLIWLGSLWASPSPAVEMNNAYDSTPPSLSLVPNWNTGWGANNVTCWNYIGQIGSASGVYLGNGWVITVAHVGTGTFTLPNGPGIGTYTPIAGSAQFFSNTSGTADLTLFRISKPPSLPPLILSQNPPVAFSTANPGTSVVMLGYGGGHGLTWGTDIVTETDIPITPNGYTYVSNDFLTDNGLITDGSANITNTSTLVTGDSGGGSFSFNSSTKKWELAGINEVTGTYDNSNETFSGMVELSTYAAQINAIILNPPSVDTPTLPLFALLIMACLLFLYGSRSLGMKQR